MVCSGLGRRSPRLWGVIGLAEDTVQFPTRYADLPVAKGGWTAHRALSTASATGTGGCLSPD
ncbi:hypothetical protein SCNRRL3882_7764 [Streptomyces chartreusis NRRL 3882]|uniref:Uncharacterized protein n=1 Tax=Streptomyces chartreusis NRRL 3882 TaxID=1079985 RepID=A0A2N9BLS8_STRCX|nr:hypothetical protein SCNRRL3882_7764 [Streptomyces chartreusis NRRL 3882]